MRAPNLPVLFHPDYNRRLRNRTESADPADCSAGARGLWRSLAITAGGDFHPAPRTRSDRNPTGPINAPIAAPCNAFRQPGCTVSAMAPAQRSARAGRTSREIRQRKPIGDTGTKLAAFLPSPASQGWSRSMLIGPPSARSRWPALTMMFGQARQFEPAMHRLLENCGSGRKIEVL
jgi:hypothetical protein